MASVTVRERGQAGISTDRWAPHANAERGAMNSIYNAAFATGILISALLNESHVIGHWILIRFANAM